MSKSLPGEENHSDNMYKEYKANTISKAAANVVHFINKGITT